MYSTCIFCHSSLGKNEAIEQFPIGRKLAFDGAKGRLWAVCAKCGRWNLTPIEERWEAIEECEKQFRGTILRSSTDQIGLARVREGTDLIRIGEPLRPEFAAWRYGRHFQHRRRVQYVTIGLGGALLVGMTIVGAPLVGAVGPIVGGIRQLANRKSDLGRARRFILSQVKNRLGRTIQQHERVSLRIVQTNDVQGWGLRLALDGQFLDYTGKDALHTAHLVAPSLNAAGADPDWVRIAVRDIEVAGSAQAYFGRVLKYGQNKGWQYTGLTQYPQEMRLAFEMASHEETERAALEGELAQLESDWKEAEEIASISDNMFLPQSITDFISRAKR